MLAPTSTHPNHRVPTSGHDRVIGAFLPATGTESAGASAGEQSRQAMGAWRVWLGMAGLWLVLAGQVGCHFQVARHTAEGRSHLQNGQMAMAVDSFQQALMANPQNSDANYNLGATYYYLAKQTQQPYLNPKSEDLLRQAIALNHSHADAYRTLAALYVETGRPNDAFQLLRGWQVGQPSNPEPLIEMARLYREHGDGTRATQYLADALTLDPNHSRALVAMGTLREEQGDYELALKNYTRSYQANSYQPEVAQRIAALQQRFQTDMSTPNGTRYANPNMNAFLR